MTKEVAEGITVDSEVCHGKPCFKGTRIQVATILELLESCQSFKEIHKGYPAVTPRHIRAALHFAHQMLDQGQFVPFKMPSHAISH